MGAIQSVIGAPAEALIPSRRIQTKYGPVEGRRFEIRECETTKNKRTVDAFLGIPFAKPPVGQLRFEKPQPPDQWTEIRKCLKFGPRAPQKEYWWLKILTIGIVKDEDCLHLNVFSPTWTPPATAGFPVMVFIHGGGFVLHSADVYGSEGVCKYLCQHDVIVVTVQYRLGLLGFFTTGDANCPGNLGLWDQTEALKWVQLNIREFGGDPKRVTVFGHSAGGASTDLLTLSPHSRGKAISDFYRLLDLFQYAIPMAGTSHAIWACQPREQLTATCRREAEKMGYRTPTELTKGSPEENRAMLDFLRTFPGEKLGRLLVPKKGADIILDYGPVIDGDFFPRPLDELRLDAPVRPYMTGTTLFEGLLFAAFSNLPSDATGVARILEQEITETKYGGRFRDFIEEGKEIYLNGTNGDKQKESEAFCHIFGDLAMNTPTLKLAKERTSRGCPVYLYTFEQHDKKIIPFFLRLKFPFQAATHGTELTYTFGISLLNPSFKLDPHHEVVLHQMTRFFTNFAKYGNPNGPPSQPNPNPIQWEPVSAEFPSRYLNISSHSEMRPDYANGRPEFWTKLEQARLTKQNSSSSSSLSIIASKI